MQPRKVDPAMYARVFDNGEGALILEDLTRRFGGSLFVKGGEEGRRETDWRLGRREVLDHILRMVNQDKGYQEPEEDSPA
jgi:hypothetical protein